MRPPIELTFTIRPRPARRPGRNAWITAIWPIRLISSWFRKLSIGTCSSGAETAIPALFTSPASGRPPSWSRATSIDSASVTSSTSGVIRSERRRSPSSGLRTPARTSKPSSASFRAVASPMPDEAPVTTTVPLAMAGTIPGCGSVERMDVERAIRERRTHKAFRSEPVGRDTLDELLELARWAPNHNLTNPWRFRVVGPEALDKLKRAAGAEGAAKLDRAPTLIAASVVETGDEIQDEEDRAAGSAAVYIVLLAAHARGLVGY